MLKQDKIRKVKITNFRGFLQCFSLCSSMLTHGLSMHARRFWVVDPYILFDVLPVNKGISNRLSRTSIRYLSTASPESPKEKSASESPLDSSEDSTSRLLSLAKPQTKLLGGAFATLSLTSSVTLAFPYITGQIIDSSIYSSGATDPALAASALFGLICLAGGGVVAR